MGSIAKALARANYLRPVVDSLNELIQRRRYEQGLQQLAQMLSGGEKNITDIYGAKKTVAGDANFQETPVDEYGSNPVPDNTPLKQLVGGINPKDRGSALNKGGTDSFLLGDYNKRAPEGSFYETQFKIIPRYKDEPLIEQSRVLRREIPKTGAIPPRNSLKTLAGDQGVGQNVDRGTEQGTFKPYDEKTVSKYTPEEQNRLAGQEINSFLRRLITSQDIPMERGQIGLSALQQLANTYKPEIEELMSVSPGASIIGKKTGKEYYKNPKTENKLFDRELSKKNDATGTWWDFDKQTGQYVDTGIKYDKNEGRIGGTTVNVKMPEENKWKDFADLVTEAEATEFTDEKGNVIKKTYEQINYDKNKLYKKGIGNLSPSALNWYNRRIKDAWKREDLSEADYYAELEQAIEEGELTNPEAIQSAMDFGSYRRYMFELDDKDYKAKK